MVLGAKQAVFTSLRSHFHKQTKRLEAPLQGNKAPAVLSKINMFGPKPLPAVP